MKDAIDHWRRTDPVLAELAATTELPQRAHSVDPFASLVEAITHQQVSIAAGRTIHARVIQTTGGTPAGTLAAGEIALRAAGLSRAKVASVLDLAGRVSSGELDLHALDALDDEAAIQQLIAVRGIGVWTAKMHLLFHMDRPDVCPWEDLGVRLAVVRFYGVPDAEAARWIQSVGRAQWTPHNSLAARVLWAARRD